MVDVGLTDTQYVRATSPEIVVGGRALGALTRASEASALTLIVAIGVLGRLVVAASRTTPRLYPDEYIYTALARSLSHGALTIRGGSAHFPAIVEPLLAAPFWWTGDPAVAYDLTKVMHAVVMSLAAVPVWWIARRLGLVPWERLACAGLTVALPGLVYAGYATADAVGVTIALVAAVMGIRALDAPSRTREAAFLGLAALATATRVQYVVLFAAFGLAALVSASGHPIRTIRQFALSSSAAGIVVGALLISGPSSVLGYYRGVVHLDVGLPLIHWELVHAFLAAFACGWVVVPAAVAGWGGAVANAYGREQRVIAVFLGTIALSVFTEASLYAANGSARFYERYILAVLPLALVYALLGIRRGGKRFSVAVGCVALILFIVATWVPLATYTAGFGKQDSPFLQAVSQLEHALGVGTAGLLVAAAAGVLAAGSALIARTRFAAAIITLATVSIVLLASVGAIAFDRSATARVASRLGPERSWVDDARLGEVNMLLLPGADRGVVQGTLFWNPSIGYLGALSRDDRIDDFATGRVAIDRNGRLQGINDRPLLVDTSGSRLILANARILGQRSTATLWQPESTTRATVLVDGLGDNNVLAPMTTVTTWRCRSSQVVRLTLRGSDSNVVRTAIVSGGGRRTVLVGRRGQVVRLLVPPGSGRSVARIESPTAGFENGRAFSALSATVQLQRDCT